MIWITVHVISLTFVTFFVCFGHNLWCKDTFKDILSFIKQLYIFTFLGVDMYKINVFKKHRSLSHYSLRLLCTVWELN